MNLAAIEIHIDGIGDTSDNKIPCWSFAVLWQEFQSNWYYGRHKSGHVVADPDSPVHIGAERLDANAAELSGMAWAMLYALQFDAVHVSLCYDSMFAANSTTALWNALCRTSKLSYYVAGRSSDASVG